MLVSESESDQTWNQLENVRFCYDCFSNYNREQLFGQVKQ